MAKPKQNHRFFPCPWCGSDTFCRTSRAASRECTVKENHRRCTNPECNARFVTFEHIHRIISIPVTPNGGQGVSLHEASAIKEKIGSLGL
ncbi:hypothetical protein A8535_003710 [Escherichia coli]|uniref:ogr/Delta-like zinc finger family protein n=1 Tax=Escherichia coli TaxID=562 RepID=UPI000E20BB56|nr:hypothetical protein [Escherichia coli]EFK2996300.1 hypothetical protein [Escherichia coli]EFO4250447.1 hypothetical protein [Escherichia coli]EJC2652710.1 ogr/Delta-like zinc finger family protein [Escherichia coli]HCO3849952.1 ogr/Delta-like zinc finger family protein [Escherichia coli]